MQMKSHARIKKDLRDFFGFILNKKTPYWILPIKQSNHVTQFFFCLCITNKLLNNNEADNLKSNQGSSCV
jgi:hypothetical protein